MCENYRGREQEKKHADLPEFLSLKTYKNSEFLEKYYWMMHHSDAIRHYLDEKKKKRESVEG